MTNAAMVDFSIRAYNRLLSVLICHGYVFQTFADFLVSPETKVIILRHDVDDRKENSLRFAEIEHASGVHGSFYFRIVPQSFDRELIRKIAGLGHEVGYHYETMAVYDGNFERAYDEFCHNLELFREIVPVKTISMHGSPLSKYDNRALWQRYDYKKSGITGEPYFDLDFDKICYLTDTGRCWDGDKFSVRDKPIRPEHNHSNSYNHFSTNIHTKSWPQYHSTFDIISAIESGTFPEQTMMTFHPQRWNDDNFEWVKELIVQNSKNILKQRFYVKI
jgi:hypothetical protein